MHGTTLSQRRSNVASPTDVDTEPGKPWTAARCNRLLRALTSRVAILRKELSWCSSAAEGTSTEGKRVASKETLLEQSERSVIEEDIWRRGTKKIRRTYSSKTAGGHSVFRGISEESRNLKERAHLHPGEISIATPVLARASRGQIHYSYVAVTEPTQGTATEGQGKRKRPTSQPTLRGPSFKLFENLRDIKRSVPAARYTIYEGIHSGLDTLLRATASNQPLRNPHRRSALLLTSLRAVPSYIVSEERVLAAHLEHTGCKSALNLRDVSTEVYDDLEMLSLSGNGWRQLRTVARSHGIHVLTDAIRAGLFHIDFCGALISLCMQQSAQREAEELLTALLSRLPFSDPKNIHTRFADDPAYRPLVMLWKYVEHTGRYTYQYTALKTMISEGILSVYWLATKGFSSLWSELLKQLSLSSDSPEAVSFLEAAMTRLIVASTKHHNSARKDAGVFSAALNTLTSLLANLTSVVMLSNQDKAPADVLLEGPCQEFFNGHIVSVLRTAIVLSDVYRKDSLGSPLILLANLILEESSVFADSNPCILVEFVDQMSSLDDCDKEIPAQYHRLVLFVCMTARYCGKGSHTQGFEQLKEIHCTLEKLAIKASRSEILYRIILDSAIAFAQQVPDCRHVDYAILVDAKLHVSHTTVDQSSPSGGLAKASKRYQRWEEGIGEWVTITPVAETTRKGMRTLAKRTASSSISLQSALRACHHEGSSSAEDTDSYSDNSGSPVNSSGPTHSVRLSASQFRTQNLLCDDSWDQDHSGGNNTYVSEPLPCGLGSESWNFTNLSEPPVPQEDSTDTEGLDSDALTEEIEDIHEPRQYIDAAPRLTRKILQSKHGRSNPYNLKSSPLTSPEPEPLLIHRKFIARVPRLGSRALRSSKPIEIFNESEDELSLISLQSEGASTQEEMLEIELYDTSSGSPCPMKKAPRAHRSVRAIAAPWSDSEDELGM